MNLSRGVFIMWNILMVLLAVGIYVYTSDYYKKINPVKYSSPLPEKFSGGLAANELLDKAERLHEGIIHWPESFAEYKGHLYTGLADGKIVRVTDKEIAPITRTGVDCEGQYEEHICGRPLGMTFSKAGRLFVADAYLGLLSIDINTGKKVNILPSKTIAEDLPLTLLNSLTFDEKEENLYITQSSTRWNISHVMVSFIEHDTSGRLLKFNLKTKKVSVVLRDLAFPNGVVLSHDKNSLLVAEAMQNKIFKYHIAGPKTGLNEELPMALPGEPDNIKQSKNGYWTTVATARTAENQTLLDQFSDKPFWRSLILHLHKLTTLPISTILKLIPDKRAKEIGFELETARLIGDYMLGYGLALEFDDKGKILRSFHSPSGKVTHLSEAFEHNGYLYLGSWRNKYLGRLKL